MIITSVIPFFFSGSFLTSVFLLLFVFGLLFKLMGCCFWN